MLLLSTRNAANVIDPLSAVLKGIAEDGGLFVPSAFPTFTWKQINAMKDMKYDEIAANILGMYFDLDADKLKKMMHDAYASFDTEEVVPIRKIGDREFVLELFHGPTIAFKDMALQVLPRLMSEAIKANGLGKDVLILTATSGDTGKAALEGFKNVAGTRIVVFYPEDGVSDMQKLQMITQEGSNTHVSAVRGNFDDAQTGVKNVFADEKFAEQLSTLGYVFSSANSINFGRLAPQIVYYVYGYVQLMKQGVIKEGDAINVCVPTGNFGNLLAAYYAKRMGLPIKKLICASNKNNVLTDFFDSGMYFANREFFKTTSPSMDILISSNIERLVFEEVGRDAALTSELMDELKKNGSYNLPDGIRTHLAENFYADFCDDSRTMSTIKRIYETEKYVMDTHTAVAQTVYDKYIDNTNDHTPTLLASTASPYKFAQDVVKALTGETIEDAFAAAEELQRLSGVQIPRAISDLKRKSVRHKSVCEKDEIGQAVVNFVDWID